LLQPLATISNFSIECKKFGKIQKINKELTIGGTMNDNNPKSEKITDFTNELKSVLNPGELAYVDQLKARIDSLSKELYESIQNQQDSQKLTKDSYTKTAAFFSFPLFITIGALLLNFDNHTFLGYLGGGALGLVVAGIITTSFGIIEAHHKKTKVTNSLFAEKGKDPIYDNVVKNYSEIQKELDCLSSSIRVRGNRGYLILGSDAEGETIIEYRQ